MNLRIPDDKIRDLLGKKRKFMRAVVRQVGVVAGKMGLKEGMEAREEAIEDLIDRGYLKPILTLREEEVILLGLEVYDERVKKYKIIKLKEGKKDV